MSRYIDADALKNKITDLDGGCAIEGTGFDIYTCEVFELIDDVPTADVVEVVRCMDCAYWEQATDISGNCNRALEITAYATDYCSYGERWGK